MISRTRTKTQTMEEEMPGLPPEVPSELRDQLGRFQRQIKVLVGNYQILVSRAENDPEDLVTVRQIEEVRKYLISFSNQQNVVLEKVRNFLANLEQEKRRHKYHEYSVLGPPPPGPILVKPKPRKKEKRKSKEFFSAKNSRSASPDLGDSDSDQTYLAYLDPGESQYRGHTEEYSVPCPSPPHCEEPEDECVGGTQEPRERDGKEQYMLSLELLTTQELEVLHSQQDSQRRKKSKGQRRVSSYVPDVADKKYRYQTFLQGSTTFSPHLRRRTPASTVSSLPRHSLPRHSLPRVNKTFSFPLETRMGTRSKSPSIARTQLDGVCDLSEEENEVSEDNMARLRTGGDITDRLEVRDKLRKRRKELEEEMVALHRKQEWLWEVRQAQRENRELLLRQQRQTEHRIEELLYVLAGTH